MIMANIKAPNTQYNGFVGGVKFSAGMATTTDEHMIQWFEARGYGVVKDAAEEKLPVPDPKPKEQEAAEEAPAKPKRSRKGS